jgi:hypothetical protein
VRGTGEQQGRQQGEEDRREFVHSVVIFLRRRCAGNAFCRDDRSRSSLHPENRLAMSSTSRATSAIGLPRAMAILSEHDDRARHMFVAPHQMLQRASAWRLAFD